MLIGYAMCSGGKTDQAVFDTSSCMGPLGGAVVRVHVQLERGQSADHVVIPYRAMFETHDGLNEITTQYGGPLRA